MRRLDENRLRRFTLFDAVIVVAVCAMGMKVHQEVGAFFAKGGLQGGPVSVRTVIQDIKNRGFLTIPLHATYWFDIAMPWVLMLSLSLFALRLIPPRPRTARFARQLGFTAIAMALGSALVVWACWLVLLVPLQMSRKIAFWVNWDYPHVFYGVTLAAMVAAGAGVAVSWIIILFQGCSRAKADWIEKAGIVLGVILIVSLPFYLWDSLLYF
jgi:hypothetical protein